MAKLGPDNPRVIGAVAVADFLGIKVPSNTSACKVAEAIRCKLAANCEQHIDELEKQVARLQSQLAAQQAQSNRKQLTLRQGNALACAQRDNAIRVASKAIQQRNDVLELLSRSHSARQAGPSQGAVAIKLLPCRGEPVPPVQESCHCQQTQLAVSIAGRP
ncbi:MAG: hypothetical protein H7Y22_13230 [Gemmatimonadaceae bacterium]|nr:hypothetical protein [Gloeobacterales cyanobacterium ES-bin-141]